MTRTCEACRLTNGDAALPGGRVFQTTHWVVEHCIGALGPAEACVPYAIGVFPGPW